jgi:CheY-like chemotaxis protein
MNEKDNFALVPRMPGALEKAEPGAKRILAGMVSDALALARRPLAPKSQPLRIVVVDDEHQYCEVIECAIRSWLRGVTVLSFHDGMEAWQELVREDPAFLMMDIIRPGLDGITTLRRLAERKVKYPILVASGNLPAAEAQARECSGPNLNVTFLSKPFSAKQLQAELSKYLGPLTNLQRQILNSAR